VYPPALGLQHEPDVLAGIQFVPGYRKSEFERHIEAGCGGPSHIQLNPREVMKGIIPDSMSKQRRHEATAAIAFQSDLGYCGGMEDLKLEVPVTEEVEVDAKTLAAIDRGTADADADRVVSLEEARKRVPQWISKFESQKPR